MQVILEDGTRLDVDDQPVGRGSMGEGYLSRDGKIFVKLFHAPNPLLRRALHQILTRYNCTKDLRHPERERYWSSLYVWPRAIVRSPRLGVVSEPFPKGVRNLIELFGPRNYAQLPEGAKSWNLRVLMAWRLAQATARMHQLGIAHSDLSNNNVLADPLTGQIRIIDIDSLVVPGFVPATVLGTPGYIAPELLSGKGRPGVATDKHALSVLLHQLLLFVHPLKGPFRFGLEAHDVENIEAAQLGESGIFISHPHDKRNRPKQAHYPPSILGADFEALFERAFVHGLRSPDARPQAVEWKTALGRLADRLVPCANPDCAEVFYPVHPEEALVCPWCGISLDIPGGIPVFCLYDADRNQPAPLEDFWIAGYPGRTLHTWHCLKGLEPDVFHDQSPVARIVHNEKGWWLENLSCEGMSEYNRAGCQIRKIPRGTRAGFRDRSIFRLGDDANARYLLVKWAGMRRPGDGPGMDSSGAPAAGGAGPSGMDSSGAPAAGGAGPSGVDSSGAPAAGGAAP